MIQNTLTSLCKMARDFHCKWVDDSQLGKPMYSQLWNIDVERA